MKRSKIIIREGDILGYDSAEIIELDEDPKEKEDQKKEK